ncbi:MAG: 4Fe-4S dicluster domain-containing protein [Burkholderiaceae bacterium]|jgi:electron transport protein HydN|nr:4Fe-4S dicluster domain-containing protein [Burkholderiaceae bacterium]
MRFISVEPDKCIGCRTCEIACVLAHRSANGETSLHTAHFYPRLRIVKNKNITAPVQCRQCDNAACIAACPVDAIEYVDDTVQIDASKCIGCRSCVVACPLGAIELVNMSVRQQKLGPVSVRDSVSVAQKCDLCIHSKTGPACVAVCPTKALRLINRAA